jgi:sigma-70-like protein
MSALALAIDANTEVYEDVKRMIFKIVHEFCSRHRHLDFNEMLSLANLTFVKCLTSYDHRRSSFSTHVYLRVRYRLLEEYRELARKAGVHKHCDTPVETCPSKKNDFWLVEFLDELSDDATTVVSLVFSGRDVPHVLSEMRSGTPATIRKAIRTVLHEIGWTSTRIIESFAEITKALS